MKKKPIMLMAHLDVVPVAPGTDANWLHRPFSGDIADGYVWGRGAWDDKSNLLAVLEALEMLVASGASPKRTVILASGHDEEVGGSRHSIQAVGGTVRIRMVKDESVTEDVQSGASGVDVAESGRGSGNLRGHLGQGRVGGAEARPGGE